jgi:hypothetical protein
MKLLDKMIKILMEDQDLYESIEHIDDENVVEFLEEVSDVLKQMAEGGPGYKTLYAFVLRAINLVDRGLNQATVEKLLEQFKLIVASSEMRTDRNYNNTVLMHLYPFYSYLKRKVNDD